MPTKNTEDSNKKEEDQRVMEFGIRTRLKSFKESDPESDMSTGTEDKVRNAYLAVGALSAKKDNMETFYMEKANDDTNYSREIFKEKRVIPLR